MTEIRKNLCIYWDDKATQNEKCCKELENRRWRDNNKPIPECRKPAAYVIITEDGERLPFCHSCWRN
jgi:hypothetical protein